MNKKYEILKEANPLLYTYCCVGVLLVIITFFFYKKNITKPDNTIFSLR